MTPPTTQAKPDYYGILRVSREASGAEIKTSFVKLAAVFHGGGKPRSIADVEEIREYVMAYRVLSDPEKRAYYDRTGFPPHGAKLAGGLERVASEEQIRSFRNKLSEVTTGVDLIWGVLDLFS
jgi:DnaJ-class molecular chaperone